MTSPSRWSWPARPPVAPRMYQPVGCPAPIDPLDEAVVLLMPTYCPHPGGCPPSLPHPRPQRDVVTGYRWQVPSGARLGATWAPPSIAPSPCCPGSPASGHVGRVPGPVPPGARRPGARRATRHHPFRRLRHRRACRGPGVAGPTRRALLVPTPQGGDVGSVWRFGRRQYQIIHTYRPILWWLASQP